MDYSQIQVYINGLFTPAQQVAFAIITLGVMSLVQVFKHSYFPFYPTTPKKKKAILWLFAFSCGIGGGISGYFTGMSPQPLWFWVFTGIVSGAAAIGIFKLFISIIWTKWIMRGKAQSG